MSADYETAIRGVAEAFADVIARAVRAELARQAPSGPTPDRLYDVAEAAAALHVARSTLYQLIGTGALRTVKVGRRRLVPRSAVADFIEALACGEGRGSR
jgi:excisionase family DNA binding protein